MSYDPHAASATTVRKAGARQWWALAVLALPCLLYSMDLTVLNLAVPHITVALRPSGPQLLWIVDIYGFLLAGALVTMGAVGDRIGRRRLLVIGAVAFGAASVLAAFAPTAELLIAARALLGLSAATLAPSTLSLIRTLFEDDGERSFAIGVWIASFSVGGAIGPIVGGALLEVFWWGAVFLIAVPVMVLLVVAAPFMLPEHRDPEGGRIDIMSAAMSVAAMLALVYAVKHTAAADFSVGTLTAAIGGFSLAVGFVRRQKSLVHPLIDLSLFSDRRFSVALAINLAGFFLAFGTLLFLAQYLQLVVGLRPFAAGLWTLFSASGFVAGSLFAPLLLSRLSAAAIMTLSLVLAAAGFGLLAVSLEVASFSLLMVASFLFSIGLAPIFALSTDAIVGAAPAERAGSAAAVAETSSELGGALGIALLGALVLGVYRTVIADTLPPGLTGASKTALSESVGVATDHLSRLDAATAAPLAEIVANAYSVAFMAAALVSAGVALAAASLLMFARRKTAQTG